MKINVTQYDIKSGTAQSGYFCPIAYALKRAFGTHRVWVSADKMRIDGIEYRLPAEAQAFVQAFDYANAVESFEFEIDLINDRLF